MYFARILFTQKNGGPADDDSITIQAHPESAEIFKVIYHSPDLKTDRMFLAGFSGVLSYMEDTLVSMGHDMDPFENIQVLTLIHPSVLYHVSDMDMSSTRELILDMIRDSLRYSVNTLPR